MSFRLFLLGQQLIPMPTFMSSVNAIPESLRRCACCSRKFEVVCPWALGDRPRSCCKEGMDLCGTSDNPRPRVASTCVPVRSSVKRRASPKRLCFWPYCSSGAPPTVRAVKQGTMMMWHRTMTRYRPIRTLRSTSQARFQRFHLAPNDLVMLKSDTRYS